MLENELKFYTGSLLLTLSDHETSEPKKNPVLLSDIIVL